MPRFIMGFATLRPTLTRGSSALFPSCSTSCMARKRSRAGYAVIVRPSITTLPLSGVSRPIIRCVSVVFPEPLSPTSA